MSEKETWKPVVGFEGLYEVSDLGRVRSLLRVRPKILQPGVGRGGYQIVSLYRRGTKKSKTVHALVLGSFVGPRKIGFECCHNNGVRNDNRLINLRYDTTAGNQRDRVPHGTSNRGERSHLAKLTVDQVRYIRRNSKAVRRVIAERFGVSVSTVDHIRYGHTWVDTL